MSWHRGRLWAFDIESTGASPEHSRIVTASLVICGGNEETESFDWLVDPGIPIEPGATEVHGITDALVQDTGMDAKEAISDILLMLAGRPKGCALTVFNAPFDLTMLDREARRHGIEPLLFEDVVDPHVIDKHIERYRSGSRKLDATCEHYNARLDSAHEACSDAEAAARCAWAIAEGPSPKHPRRGTVVRRQRDEWEMMEYEMLAAEWLAVRHDLAKLHNAQIEWQRGQALGLADYFRMKGDTESADRVSVGWPMVPFRETGQLSLTE